ncbi:PA2169 family four-helix-bundle protein [Marinivivus vitaminiproducens]|uniref:PA2169 family four-helix-bundle protein n=1 Tax=Marinivivus vitaminiproducens TaxID=3035935 RepID=UPI0027AAF856|nr:PA2169 family four-helix-bundle protein [Geminicoccaceae bacterium SCSIO 64248]
MATGNEHDIKVLNGLIETTLDSADGYRQAAKDTKNDGFVSLFNQRADERQRVAGELQNEVRKLGGTPEDDGTVLAAAHRVFLNLKNMVTSGDQAIVDTVEDGEDHIKAKYEDALKDEDVTPATQQAITRAYESVRAGHDQMRDLKHSMHGRTS